MHKTYKITIGRRGAFGFILLALFIISGCTFNSTKVVQEEVYNNDDRLVQQSNTYTYTNTAKKSITDKKLSVEFSTFTGVDTFWIISSDIEQELKINIDQQIKGGKFKTIIVSADNKTTEINVLSEGSQAKTTSITLKPTTEYRIKIVGSKAKGNIKMELSSEHDIHLTTFE
ncbi:hypothetical protein J2Z32_000151 [Paenibacillus turicensis]|uniref:Lipoprotein n=1 Tax=Paenibacillus turicensis TaxID=160487 RepID=A0ABS4FMC2_9BACL|nr:hypothetical protein [Paenibacillus turicensis]MBP1903539.1 hypothetical protein [Paenibacillus turicensis]